MHTRRVEAKVENEVAIKMKKFKKRSVTVNLDATLKGSKRIEYYIRIERKRKSADHSPKTQRSVKLTPSKVKTNTFLK